MRAPNGLSPKPPNPHGIATPITACWVDPGEFRPFEGESSRPVLEDLGVHFHRNPFRADFLLFKRSSSSRLPLARWMRWGRTVVWTNEPRRDTTAPDEAGESGTLILNAFSRKVFWHNFHFLGAYHANVDCDLGLDLQMLARDRWPEGSPHSSRRPCIAIFGWRPPERCRLLRDGKDIDLHAHRQRLAIELAMLGACDIAGAGWPSEVRPVEQGGYASGIHGDWWTRKLELLRNYRFTLCSENSSAPYYCTEKIWHSILAGCLPLYAGHETIRETFPEGTFVDVSQFPSGEALRSFMDSMPETERLGRLDRCREIMREHARSRLNSPSHRSEIHRAFASTLRSKVDN